ncbi:MAG TPA: hypothetical protein VF407_19355 [Polyangiaceae bacterium]
MFKPFAISLATFALASALFTTGCSSSSDTGTGSGSGSGNNSDKSSSGGSDGGGSGGTISASDLGADCSGGTSTGDSVVFTGDSTCPTGECLADATGSDFAVYCTADCTNAECPSGYTCKTTTIDATKACFKN